MLARVIGRGRGDAEALAITSSCGLSGVQQASRLRPWDLASQGAKASVKKAERLAPTRPGVAKTDSASRRGKDRPRETC